MSSNGATSNSEPTTDGLSAGLPDRQSSAALSTPGETGSVSASPGSRSPSEEVSWKGWAELENDPVIFRTLLREWGVSDVEVNEVVSLDSVFEYPPGDVYGLILLFRWVAPETENDITEAPAGVWFANQTSSFSCATVALMNIINNHATIELGPVLNDFRANTVDMTPKARGHALDSLDHVRDVHNSFAREFDKMNVDLRLKQDFVAAEKKKKAASAKRPRKRLKETEEFEEDEGGFHFVAYVPAGACVWRMDGMERLPRKLGDLGEGESWIAKALPALQSQLESVTTNALEYSLLSLTRMTDWNHLEEDRVKMDRAREDWGPFIAQVVRIYAEKGILKAALQ